MVSQCAISRTAGRGEMLPVIFSTFLSEGWVPSNVWFGPGGFCLEADEPGYSKRSTIIRFCISTAPQLNKRLDHRNFTVLYSGCFLMSC
jgi:hypothetical protein